MYRLIIWEPTVQSLNSESQNAVTVIEIGVETWGFLRLLQGIFTSAAGSYVFWEDVGQMGAVCRGLMAICCSSCGNPW